MRSVILRRLTEADRAAMLEMLTDETVRKTYMVPDMPTEEAKDKLFTRFCALSASSDRYVRGVELDGRLIGFLNDVGIEGGSIELGWVIHPAYHNHGWGTRAAALAVQELFFGMGFAEVIAGAFEENIASRRVMEKIGMRRIEKTEEIEYRGKTHRCVYYCIEH